MDSLNELTAAEVVDKYRREFGDLDEALRELLTPAPLAPVPADEDCECNEGYGPCGACASCRPDMYGWKSVLREADEVPAPLAPELAEAVERLDNLRQTTHLPLTPVEQECVWSHVDTLLRADLAASEAKFDAEFASHAQCNEQFSIAIEQRDKAEADLAAEKEAHAKTKWELELATDFCDSPCGHSSMWAYTEDGGKHIVCLLCIKADREEKARQIAAKDAVIERMRGELRCAPCRIGSPILCEKCPQALKEASE